MEHDTNSSPGIFGTFLKGAGSGLFSGGLMVACLGLVSLTGLLPFHLTFAAGMVLTTTLFTGAMAIKRTFMDSPARDTHGLTTKEATQVAMIPTVSQGITTTPDMAPSYAPPITAASWTERTGAAPGSNRIQSILDNGSLSDKSRAAAILAERNNAAEQGNGIA